MSVIALLRYKVESGLEWTTRVMTYHTLADLHLGSLSTFPFARQQCVNSYINRSHPPFSLPLSIKLRVEHGDKDKDY